MKTNLLILFIIFFFIEVKLKAQIIYTDIDPDSTIFCPVIVPNGGDSSHYFYFDLNQDDTSDFRVVARHYTYWEINDWHDQFLIDVEHLNDNKVTDQFASGEIINSNQTWVDFHPLSQFWTFPSEAYIGLKLVVNTLEYFGWVRLDWSISSRKITIKDFAYNSTAGQPINAGQINSSNYVDNSNDLIIFMTGCILYIQINGTLSQNDVIEIYNSNGILIQSSIISQQNTGIYLGGHSPGNYIVKIVHDNIIKTATIFVP
ncbi:MAG: T9SS type A sorting domain-containing protein [Bacteroidota bacterium]